MDKLNVLIAGSTGYIGTQLVKLLCKHKNVKIKYLCGNTSVGKNISYYEKNLKKYDYLSFHSLTDDEKYEIKGIFGHRNFKDKKSCLKEQNEIKEEFSNLYKNTEKTSGEKYYGETTSTFTYNYFDFPSGERISVQCYFFESGEIRLSIALVSSVELIKWLEEGNRSTSNNT